MKKQTSYLVAKGIICSFFISVMLFSFIANYHYPVLVVAGEASVGTWMSGVLLIISAVFCLISGMQKGWNPWLIFVLFFIVLAMDERFMIHEHMKEYIIFRTPYRNSKWLFELPVILGALLGLVISFIMWRNLNRKNKPLLFTAIVLGSLSVIYDIFNAGVLIEESLKLLAELVIVLALIGEIKLKIET